MNEKKNGMPKKNRILKYVNCQWEEMIHIKINWSKREKTSKEKTNAKKKDIIEKKNCKRGK